MEFDNAEFARMRAIQGGVNLWLFPWKKDFLPKKPPSEVDVEHCIQIQILGIDPVFQSEEWPRSLAALIGEAISVEKKEQASKRLEGPLIGIKVLDISKVPGSISILGWSSEQLETAMVE